jgi:4-amino-4-deoxy-L-arabinose transferase-like glycosyltransferase
VEGVVTVEAYPAESSPAVLDYPSEAPGRDRWLGRWRDWPPARKYLIALLLIFVVKQVVTVFVMPPFTGHDEVAHFGYLRIVADEHRIPIIPDLEEWRASWTARGPAPGDYLPNDLYRYRRFALDWCCDPRDQPHYANVPPGGMSLAGQIFPNGWQYVANHPPLYYVLMTPVFKAVQSLSLENQMYVLRAAAIPIGMLVIWLTYLMAGLLFPRERLMAMVAPTFVAFQTQVSYESAMVNNDIVLIGMFTVLVYLLLRGIRQGFTLRSSALVGLVLGLGLLAKASMLAAAPLVALAIIFTVGLRQVRRWAGYGTVTVVVAALVCWPWYAFLYRTYGNLSALEQVKDLQYSWTYRNGNAPSMWDLFWNKDFALFRWRETWGEFGWRIVHLDGWLLFAIGLPLLVFAVVALGALIRQSWARAAGSTSASLSREQVLGLWLMFAVCIVAYGAMLQFGTDFVLTQARYYFNAVGAVGILMAFGLRQLVPVRYHPAAAVTFLIAMMTANLLIYTQYVIPYWHLPS